MHRTNFRLDLGRSHLHWYENYHGETKPQERYKIKKNYSPLKLRLYDWGRISRKVRSAQTSDALISKKKKQDFRFPKV